MASSREPEVITYKADGSIARGKAVKIGSDKEHVAIGAANTDDCIGITLDEVVASDDLVEVCRVGGGALAKLGENVVAGKNLVSHTDGTLVKANASGDRVIAVALQDGSSGDLIDVDVVKFLALAAE